MADTPYAQSAALTAISVMYRNAGLIADRVLPRVPVMLPTFEYTVFPTGLDFTVPDTKVGRLGKPNQLFPSSDKVPGAVMPYGLEVPVPRRDQRIAAAMAAAFPQAAATQNPMDMAAMLCTDVLLLDREIRAANLVFSLNTYLAGQRVTLSGNAQWSDYVNSNPINAITAAMDLMLVRPNIGVIGRQAFTVLSQHPKVVGAVLGNAGTSGVVTAAALAGVLGLQEIVIGDAWVNNARLGQAATQVRTWGKHMALLSINALGGPDGMPSFGWTAQFGERVGATIFDPDIGLYGADNVRIGEEVKEVIAAQPCGYFFQNCVA